MQAFQLVFYIGFGRQNNDRNVASTDVLLDILTQFDSVHYRHHNVGDDDIYLIIFQLLQRFFTVSGFQSIEQPGQTAAEIMAYFLIVFHNKDSAAFFVTRLYGLTFHFLRIDEVHVFGVGGVHLLFFLGSIGVRPFRNFIDGQVLRQIDGERASLTLFAL